MIKKNPSHSLNLKPDVGPRPKLIAQFGKLKIYKGSKIVLESDQYYRIGRKRIYAYGAE